MTCKYCGTDKTLKNRRICSKCKYHQHDSKAPMAKTQFLWNYKLSKGCEACGYNKNPVALQFDHLDPKAKTNGKLHFSKLSWAKLVDEINKCRVLCANCHAIHTHWTKLK